MVGYMTVCVCEMNVRRLPSSTEVSHSGISHSGITPSTLFRENKTTIKVLTDITWIILSKLLKA